MVTYYIHHPFPTQRVAHAVGEAVEVSPQQLTWYLPDGRVGLEPPFVPSPWIRVPLYRDELAPVWMPSGAEPGVWERVPLYRDAVEPTRDWVRVPLYRDDTDPTMTWGRVSLYRDELES